MIMMMRMVELCVVWISAEMEEVKNVLLRMVEVREVPVVFAMPTSEIFLPLLPNFPLLLLLLSGVC
jgi:hypothetical protein